MARTGVSLSGIERTFSPDEIIVSKTDLQGRLTYVNDIFLDVAGYSESELIGQPHSIIRHPGMPQAVFRLLWATIREGREIFAYVNNRAKNGDHYWVLAHITPNHAGDGSITGYHSNRRVPRRDAIARVEPLYRRMRRAEEAASGADAGMAAATAILNEALAHEGMSYDEFVLSL
ncbi:PAS domain S-box-containing protein [Azospirillum fermentarium]|uniref:PAS domain-containing protein n=1 Tax=Azospirillum fermentarium TaxID=1233114 RepID=UPI002226E261|nr:PAS domain-containing protein [Azospirillum fermentarium]MCW2248717.1 PAS domain S-box-containing protein [Azospirillum fermentarium]